VLAGFHPVVAGVNPRAGAVATHATLGAGEAKGWRRCRRRRACRSPARSVRRTPSSTIVPTPGGGLLARSATDISSRFGAEGASVSAGATPMLRLRLDAVGRGGPRAPSAGSRRRGGETG